MALGHFSHVEYGALNWSLTACGIIQSSDMVRVVQYCRMKVFLTAVLSYHGMVLCGCHSMIVAWTTITPWHGIVWVLLHDSSLDHYHCVNMVWYGMVSCECSSMIVLWTETLGGRQTNRSPATQLNSSLSSSLSSLSLSLSLSSVIVIIILNLVVVIVIVSHRHCRHRHQFHEWICSSWSWILPEWFISA